MKLKALEESFVDIDGFNSEEEPDLASQETVATEESDASVLKNKDLNITDSIEDNKDETVNTDKTWGAHLNNVKEDVVEKTENKTSFHSNITQKLFDGAKFSKRNPRKSLSFSHRKSDAGPKTEFLSQPTFRSKDLSQTESVSDISTSQPEDGLLSDNLRVVSGFQKVISQPLNILQNTQKQIRNIDTGWLKRVTESAGSGTPTENLFQASCSTTSDTVGNNLDDDICDSDVVYSSEDESCNAIFHAAKKQCIGLSQKSVSLQPVLSQEQANVSNDIASTSNKKLDFSNIFSKAVPENSAVTDYKTATSKDNAKTLERNNSVRKSSRQRKTLVQLQNSPDSEVDPFHSDEDSDDPNFSTTTKDKKPFGLDNLKQDSSQVTSSKTAKVNKSKEKPARKTKTKRDTKAEEKSEMDEYELEYSVKPRIISTPRVKNVKMLLKSVSTETKPSKMPEKKEHTEPEIKDKTQQLKEKLQKKISDGTLNDNYRTINLKKKVFVRGKKNSSYSKYKKQMWKNKKKALCGPDMDMGGCDGGELVCFNCGQTGHFARQCKSGKGDTLLPIPAEEDCPYPTLEEASQMARESVLAIRKPKIGESQSEENGESNLPKDNEECDVFGDSDDDDLLVETLKLESAFKLNMQDYIDTTGLIKPVYEVNTDGNIMGEYCL